MLFDLRSKHRRRAVRVIYLFLALVMLSGLVLVGVGTGNNNGGLLNAFTNNGSGGGQNPAESEVNAAIRATKKHPNSAANWANLVQARWAAASSGSNYNSTTGAFTSSGKVQLNDAAGAWQKYLSLSSGKPALETSELAARVYQSLAQSSTGSAATTQWANASETWQYVIQASGSAGALKGDVCTALTSYAAGQASKGGLASAAALKVVTKSERLQLKETLNAAKKSTTSAAQYVISDC